MSTPFAPEPAMLIMGVLLAAEVDEAQVLSALETEFGPVAHSSGFVPFIQTKYYQREMGEGVRRGYLAIAGRVSPESLPEAKLRSNALEGRWLVEGKRSVNLDPGLLDLNRMVLASGKNVGHRVYLGRGIYGELEYLFRDGAFMTLPWTYPDYAMPETQAFFNGLREIYRRERAIHT